MADIRPPAASDVRSAVYQFISHEFGIGESTRYIIEYHPWDGIDYTRDRHKWLPTDPETEERLRKEARRLIASMPGKKIGFDDVMAGDPPAVIANEPRQASASDIRLAVQRFVEEEYGIDVAMRYMAESSAVAKSKSVFDSAGVGVPQDLMAGATL